MMPCSGSAAILCWPWSAFVCVSNNLAFTKHEAGLPTTLQRLDAPCRAVQSDCFSGRSSQRQAGHCVQLCQPVGSSISARLSIFTVWCGWEASCCCSWPCRGVLRGPVTAVLLAEEAAGDPRSTGEARSAVQFIHPFLNLAHPDGAPCSADSCSRHLQSSQAP